MAENNDEVKEKKKKKSSLKPKDGEKKSSRKSSSVAVEQPSEESAIKAADESVKIETTEEAATTIAESSVDISEQTASLPKKSISQEKELLPKKSISQEKELLPKKSISEEKSPMEIINEILNPPLMEFDPTKPYVAPVAVKAGDVNALQELDERKIMELKEAFFLFDLDGDGCIDAEDLKGTFGTLGDDEVPEGLVEQMLSEAMNPLDFDAFVMLLGYKTIELDPEDVLIEALSKWDLEKTGVICEEKIRHDLICYGDRFTEKEAQYALEEAPIANKNRAPGEPPMIDYQGFCKILGGLRKRKQSAQC